jgi:hypothetical protein
MTKEALAYLTELGIKPEDRLINFDNDERWMVIDSDGKASEIKPRAVLAESPIAINTLTGMIDYIKANLERSSSNLILHIEDEKRVKLIGTLEADGRREVLAEAEAIIPRFYFDKFLNSEEFVINFQSKFVKTEDRELLLRVMGNVVEENVKTTGDDGVSQAVSIRQGVATKADVKVPNPVTLAPFRTFLEVQQPESQFIFRLQDGPRGAIFEADGGAWRNQAIVNIREYLTVNLADEIEKRKVTILA